MRVRSAGALQLSRRAGAARQQRRSRQCAAAPRWRRHQSASERGGAPAALAGRVDYEPTWHAMQRFTDERDAATPDEIWLLEHPPVFTLGMNADPRHVLDGRRYPGGADRPRRAGDLPRAGPAGGLSCCSTCGARASVCATWSRRWNARSSARWPASASRPASQARCAGGLRRWGQAGQRRHARPARRELPWLALNVDMELEPFGRINPCGYPGLAVTQLRASAVPDTAEDGGGRAGAMLIDRSLEGMSMYKHELDAVRRCWRTSARIRTVRVCTKRPRDS